MLGMPFLEFLHSSSIIKQSKFNTTKQGVSDKNSFERKDPANGIGGLCTFMQPIERTLAIELNRCRNSKWIVSADLLDEFTIPGCTGVGYYDEVKWSLLRPMSLQSDFNWHFK